MLQDGNEVYKYAISNPQLLSSIYFFLKHQNAEIRDLASTCFKQFCMVLNSKQTMAEHLMIKGCTFHLDMQLLINLY